MAREKQQTINATGKVVGPLTIELTLKTPNFIGVSLIRWSQLPRLLPRPFSLRVPGEGWSKPKCFIVISTDYDRSLSIDKIMSEYVDECTY